MKNRGKKHGPNFSLWTMLKQKCRFIYIAAKKLDLRDDELSRIVHGHHELTEDLVQKLERLLDCDRSEFLPVGHPLTVKRGQQ